MNITTTTTTIRAASPADIPAVAELFDLYRQFYEQEPDGQLALEFITERLCRRESVILVAENPQVGLIGFCQLYPTFCSVEARPIYCLYDLFVIPAARRSGAGSLLLQAANAEAASSGKVRMDLTTARTNAAAQSLYKSLGWVRDDVFFAYSKNVVQS
jgi:ribosomal protein S18 acetylase RimI-like enzyme